MPTSIKLAAATNSIMQLILCSISVFDQQIDMSNDHMNNRSCYIGFSNCFYIIMDYNYTCIHAREVYVTYYIWWLSVICTILYYNIIYTKLNLMVLITLRTMAALILKK